jgi:hypothetical protein
MGSETFQHTVDQLANVQVVPAIEKSTSSTRISADVIVFIRALNENSEELVGRMSLEQISQVIGMDISRSDYGAIGTALAHYGCRKGRSGPNTYYVFE